MTEEIDCNLIKAIAETPALPQRRLAEQLGCSLGKINYCLKALIEKGLIKVENFYNNENKRSYAYKLTPAGVEEKARLTVRFLRRKMQEYDRLKDEIIELQKEVRILEVNK
ncbi:MAG: MarR family EPS-associated transcriptional regulator [Candidatus Riflebacteria bacterium]